MFPYATGTPKAKAEFKELLGKVQDKDPGKAQDIITNMRKSGFDVGVSSEISGGNGQNMLHGGRGKDSLEERVPNAEVLPIQSNKTEESTFWNDVAAIETKDQTNEGYDAVNGNGDVKNGFALGKYQMRSSALKATGYLDKEGNWIGENGIKSYEDFLYSPSVQDKAINEYGPILEKELSDKGAIKYVGQEIDGLKAKIKLSRANLIAAAHRQGAGHVNKYLKYMKDHDWKSDFSDAKGKEADMYKSVETRLRLFQNHKLP